MQKNKKNKTGEGKPDDKAKEKEKGNVYDKIFKENSDVFFLPLAEKYLNFKIVKTKTLEAKLQSTVEREVDFMRIVETADGEEFILHIEFQASNEPDMIYRMKEYDAMIQHIHHLEIRHFVIFLGPGKMTMKTGCDRHMMYQF